MFSGIANQTTLITHFIHDLVTTVNTQATGNTFILQTIADINTRRAYLNADTAINTRAQAFCLESNLLVTRATWFAALGIVSNDQRVLIKHRTLKAGIRAHVFTYLFTYPACVAVSSKTIKQQPEGFPRAKR